MKRRSTPKLADNVLFQYPKPQMQETGCKVSWYGYKKYSDALAAAKVAVSESIKLAKEGYDFGFNCPGNISQGKWAGHYVVVIP